MANQITDNRTLVADGEVLNPGGSGVWTDEGHNAMAPGLNSDVFVEGSNSVGDRVSGAGGIIGIGWDYEANTDFTDTVVYMWSNMGAATKLESFANGGVAMRVTGATDTDWAEITLDGADTYGGGWVMRVVDIERLLADPDRTNGTPPTITTINWVGMIYRTAATAPGGDDNAFVDAFWTLDINTPGILVEGDNSGVPWTWADIEDAGDVTDTTKAWGTITEKDGVFFINTPIQFGVSDGTDDDDFQDAGAIVVWEDNIVKDNFYGFSGVTGAETGTCIFGTKIGSGEDAVGVNGGSITTGGPRWFLSFEDTDYNTFGMYGVALVGLGDVDVNDDQTEWISCVFVNCAPAGIGFNAGTTGDNGALIRKCFFSAAPGPAAQIRILNGVDFATDQFDGNSFVSMSWFAIEFTDQGPLDPNGYTLKDTFFQNNGTGRSVLCSHATETGGGGAQLRILSTGTTNLGTADVTNGSQLTITMAGTADVFLFTIATWEEANDASDGGTATDNSGTLTQLQHNPPYTVDDDSFSVAAARVPSEAEILFDQAGDTYDDGVKFDRDTDFLSARIGIDNLTPSTTQREQDPSHSAAETETNQIIVEVPFEAASTPVAQIDPTFRPWTRVSGATTVTFGYGAGNNSDNPNRKLYLVVVALDAAAAGDTAVTAASTTWDTVASSQALTEITNVLDDNTGGGGSTSALRTTVLRLEEADASLSQGDFTVEQNVTTTFQNIRSDSEIRVYDTGTTNELSGDESVGGVLTQVAINDGGTGYSVNDVLTLVGGTGTAATVTVDAVSGGVITAVSITTGGDYTEDPPSPNSPTVAPAGGSGATLDVTVRGSHAFTYNAATQGNFDVVVHHLDFVYFRQNNQVPEAQDASFQISQTIDRNFENP